MNKYIVFAFLFAAVAAEDGYTCTDNDGTWTDQDLASPEITTHEECKSACDTAVEAGNTEANDWCCAAMAFEADLYCNLYNIATAGLDIKVEYSSEGYTVAAWAWEAGVSDLTPVEETPADDDAAEDDEEDEDLSVRMTTSALAAASIAIIAM